MEQQHQDEDGEDAHLAQRVAQEQAAQRLDHADQQPAGQCAGEAAHAAQHHDGEGHQHEAAADLRIDVVRRQQETGGRAQAGHADAERQRVDPFHVDAHEPGALLLARHRADGASQVRAPDQPQQAGGHGQRAAECDQLGQRDQRRPDLDRRQRIGRVDAARIGLEPDQREVLQHDGQSQRDQQDVLVLAMAGAVDHQPLQQVAQREHARHHQRQRRVGIQPQPLVEQIDRVQRHHQRRAMGEVDDVQHAVDQGQAQRHQRVHGAGGQAVEHGAEEDGGIQRHRVRPSRGTARPPAGTRAG